MSLHALLGPDVKGDFSVLTSTTTELATGSDTFKSKLQVTGDALFSGNVDVSLQVEPYLGIRRVVKLAKSVIKSIEAEAEAAEAEAAEAVEKAIISAVEAAEAAEAEAAEAAESTSEVVRSLWPWQTRNGTIIDAHEQHRSEEFKSLRRMLYVRIAPRFKEIGIDFDYLSKNALNIREYDPQGEAILALDAEISDMETVVSTLQKGLVIVDTDDEKKEAGTDEVDEDVTTLKSMHARAIVNYALEHNGKLPTTRIKGPGRSLRDLTGLSKQSNSEFNATIRQNICDWSNYVVGASSSMATSSSSTSKNAAAHNKLLLNIATALIKRFKKREERAAQNA